MKIHYDAVKFLAAGVTVEFDQDVARITIAPDPGAFYVQCDGDHIILMPERAASHRELLKTLGVEGPKLPDWMNQ